MTHRVALIAAVWGDILATGNGLPWNNRQDLTHFRTYTANRIMLVGHNTARQMPALELAGRRLRELTREELTPTGIHKLLDSLNCSKACEPVVIGGGRVYEAFLRAGVVSHGVITLITPTVSEVSKMSTQLHSEPVRFPWHLLAGATLSATKLSPEAKLIYFDL